MFREPAGWEHLPVLKKRYAGRPVAEVRAAAKRAFLSSLGFMFVGAFLFSEAVLGFFPGLGLAVRFALLLPAMVLFVVGVGLGSLWNHLDRALFGEPPPAPEWGIKLRTFHVAHIIASVIGGGFTTAAVGAIQAQGADPVLALLIVAAALAGTLGGATLLEALHRRRRMSA